MSERKGEQETGSVPDAAGWEMGMWWGGGSKLTVPWLRGRFVDGVLHHFRAPSIFLDWKWSTTTFDCPRAAATSQGQAYHSSANGGRGVQGSR